MRKIRIIEHISLDGMIQAPGGPDEDRDGDFEHGGWIVPHSGPAVGEAIGAGLSKAFDLLLGRRTYDIWSDYWPIAGSSPMADSLNAATKYVATRRPDSLKWGPVENPGPDIIEGVKRPLDLRRTISDLSFERDRIAAMIAGLLCHGDAARSFGQYRQISYRHDAGSCCVMRRENQ